MIKVTETVTQFERSKAALSTTNKNHISEKNTNNPLFGCEEKTKENL